MLSKREMETTEMKMLSTAIVVTTTTTAVKTVKTKGVRGGWGKSGQGQIGPLVFINVTCEVNIGTKVVMILL